MWARTKKKFGSSLVFLKKSWWSFTNWWNEKVWREESSWMVILSRPLKTKKQDNQIHTDELDIIRIDDNSVMEIPARR